MASKVVSIEDRIPKLKEHRKKKANRRLAIILLLFFLLIISLIYFQSPLSKVGKIVITGNQVLMEEQVIHSSGITNNTVIFNIHKDAIKEKLLTLPEVSDVEVKLTFPNHVQIHLKEYKPIAYLFDDNKFSLLLENGKVVATNRTIPSNQINPILKNFKDKDLIELAAKQLSKLPGDVKHAISEIIYSPKKTDQYSIVAFMNDGFEVHATLRTFAEKMQYYPSLVKQIDPDKKGIIDLEVGLFFKSYQSSIETNDGEEVEINEEGNEESEN
ncbi:cell division protein FtsQ/DivIB [Caldibacillus lycopersici]|uniref:Cell division protein DivIB n=1 Tax=Perspicuibacillus lycopersici TaxID=1325689 RepID=A0AAE3IU91_9BACI|nr:cell division protein FtsQ/DivIB [Perspicuibacillus lycopersici]MCU9612195.1 cell division protein FtsQ/DivIB [Perspicuibacillus lycopersici]